MSEIVEIVEESKNQLDIIETGVGQIEVVGDNNCIKLTEEKGENLIAVEVEVAAHLGQGVEVQEVGEAGAKEKLLNILSI